MDWFNNKNDKGKKDAAEKKIEIERNSIFGKRKRKNKQTAIQASHTHT